MKLRPKRTSSGKCQGSGKRSYRTELDAKMAMANNPRLKRPYRCPHGDHWHTTSRG